MVSICASRPVLAAELSDAGRGRPGEFDANGADLFFHGPTNLRTSILKGLEARGIAPRETYFEMFEFR